MVAMNLRNSTLVTTVFGSEFQIEEVLKPVPPPEGSIGTNTVLETIAEETVTEPMVEVTYKTATQGTRTSLQDSSVDT